MKIGINARFLNKPHTGIGQYTCKLLQALSQIDSKNEYFLAVAEKAPLEFSKNFQQIVIPEIAFGPPGLKKAFWEQIQVPKKFRELEIDLAHFLYPSNPRFALHIPAIVTIHDAIPWRRPEYRRSFLSSCYHLNSKSSLKKASHFITVSALVKKHLLQLLGPLTEATVIHNAASDIFFKKSPPAELSRIRKKFNLAGKFILYVGGYDERKNVRLLLDIFATHISPVDKIDLVLAGIKSHVSALYSSYDYQPQMPPDAKGKIIRIGDVSENELHALYQSCACFINLSGDEGFNIPIIEAAASGAAIIASDIEVHREVIGSAALLTKIDNPAIITEKIIRLLSDENLQKQYQKKAQLHARDFSWQKSAHETLSLYQKML